MNYHEFVLPQTVPAPPASSNFVLHVNTRSACSKHDDIISLLGQFPSKVNTLMLTETWCQDGGDMLSLDGYTSFFLNRRDRRGGGVAVFVNKVHNYEKVIHFCCICNDYEILTLKESMNIVSVVYRPPNGNFKHFIDFSEQFLEYVRVNRFRLICGGDYNINTLDDICNARNFASVLSSSGFTNVISTPTRITVSSISALDFLITNI